MTGWSSLEVTVVNDAYLAILAESPGIHHL
jgi:hypothetical protein